tara:strand:- start:325 stop:876 length:552 start_codon:yes stop_codon:yes gene_type:complete
MNLTNIQKKLNPSILEQGRKSAKIKLTYPFIWMFVSMIILIPFANYLDNIFSNENWMIYYYLFVSFLPCCIGIVLYFLDPSIKYHKTISGTFKLNEWGFRAYSNDELNFISKNFKKVKWKISLNIVQNLKDQNEMIDFKNKNLEKIYIKKSNFTELDNIEIKKLETIYSVIIGFIILLLIDLT